MLSLSRKKPDSPMRARYTRKMTLELTFRSCTPCGHDLHMASLLGAAEIMARSKNTWHGTLVLIGQPAEETISGAARMIADGFLTRFPKPDAGVALHVGNGLEAGKVGVVPGIYDTNADSLRITIYGKGGHGSAPHNAIDPIVIAARTILALQTIPSREVKPGEFVVITVGYIRAGNKGSRGAPAAEASAFVMRAIAARTCFRISVLYVRTVRPNSASSGMMLFLFPARM